MKFTEESFEKFLKLIEIKQKVLELEMVTELDELDEFDDNADSLKSLKEFLIKYVNKEIEIFEEIKESIEKTKIEEE